MDCLLILRSRNSFPQQSSSVSARLSLRNKLTVSGSNDLATAYFQHSKKHILNKKVPKRRHIFKLEYLQRVIESIFGARTTVCIYAKACMRSNKSVFNQFLSLLIFTIVHDTVNDHRMQERQTFLILHLNFSDWSIDCNFSTFEPPTSDLDFGDPQETVRGRAGGWS